MTESPRTVSGARTLGSNLRLKAPGPPLGQDSVLVILAIPFLVLLFILLFLVLLHWFFPDPFIQLLRLITVLI